MLTVVFAVGKGGVAARPADRGDVGGHELLLWVWQGGDDGAFGFAQMGFQAGRRPIGISRGDGVQQRSMLDAPLDAAAAGRKYRQSVPFDRQSLLTDQTQQAWPGARLVKRLVERAVAPVT